MTVPDCNQVLVFIVFICLAQLSSALVLTDNWERCHAALDIDTDNIIAADNNDQDNNEDNDDINLTPDDLVLFSGSTKIG